MILESHRRKYPCCCPRCEGAGWNHQLTLTVARGIIQQRQRVECPLCDGLGRVDRPTEHAWVTQYIEKLNRIDFNG